MIPAGITTATVHLDAPVSFTGEPGRLHVVITPSASLIWTATGTPLGHFTDTFSLNPGKELVVELPHTDQPGFEDGFGNAFTGWYYTATVVYEKDGRRINFPARDFQILAGQEEVDLALVPAGEAAPVPEIAPILPVTSLEGLTGSVTLADLQLELVDNTPDAQKPISTAQAAGLLSRTRDGGDTAQTATRRYIFSDLPTSPGALIDLEHNATGAAVEGNQAYGLDIHNNEGARQALVIHQYSNVSSAMQIDNTDSQPAIYIQNTQNLNRNPDGDGTGDYLYFADHGTLRLRVRGNGSMFLSAAAASTAPGLYVLNASTQYGLDIAQSGAQTAVRIKPDAGGGADGFYPLLVEGRNIGPHFKTTLDGNIAFTVTKDGVGAGDAVRIVNKGTGVSLDLRDATASRFFVRATGTVSVNPLAASTNPGVYVNNPSTQYGLDVAQSGAGSAVRIKADAGGGADGYYPLVVDGRDYGPHFFSSQNGPRLLTLTKNGTGSGEVLQIVNKGTGLSASFRDAASAIMSQVAANGEYEHLTAGAGIILKSPNGTRHRITVADDGALTTTAL